MTMRVFENWTPESVPCPRCRTLLPSADATCPRCGHEATSPVPPRPIPTSTAATTQSTYPVAPSWPSAPPPGPVPPPFYPVVRRARRGPRVGRIVLVILVVALLGAGAYGLHRVTQHAQHQLAAQPNLGSSLLPVPSGGPITLSAIPVRLDELPVGWAAIPPVSDGSDDVSGDKDMARCLGRRNIGIPADGNAESDFQQGRFVVLSSAQSYPTHAAVRSDLSMLSDPQAPRCYDKLMHGQLVAGNTGARVHAFRMHLSSGAGGGPAQVAGRIRGHAVLSDNGRSVRLFLDFVFFAGDRVESTLVLMRAGEPVDRTLEKQLVKAVAQRTGQL